MSNENEDRICNEHFDSLCEIKILRFIRFLRFGVSLKLGPRTVNGRDVLNRVLHESFIATLTAKSDESIPDHMVDGLTHRAQLLA